MNRNLARCLTVLALVAAVGCSGGKEETPATKDNANVSGQDAVAKTGARPKRRKLPKRPAVPAGPAVGTMAPDITGPDIDGEQFSLADYRGKIVMLDFWGNW